MNGIIIYLLSRIINFLRYPLMFYGVFGVKVSDKKNRMGASFILLLSGIVAVYIFLPDMTFVTAVIYFFAFFCLFENAYLERFLMYIPAFLFFNFIDETVAILEGIIIGFNPLNVLDNNTKKYEFIVILPTFIIFCLIALKNKTKEKKKKLPLKISGKMYGLLLVSLFSVVMLMSLVSYIAFKDDKEKVLKFISSVVFFSIATVVIILLLFFYLLSVFKSQKVQSEMLEILEKKNELQKEYYQRLYLKNEEMRSFRHDYHHHITYLIQQIQRNQYEEAYKYLQSLNTVGEQILMQKDIYSGNQVIDSVIYGILSKNENAEIDFTYQGKVRNYLGIEDIDLCIILSNALENAAEACRMCKEKKINMKIMIYNENIVIQISNTYMKDFINLTESSKEDKENHGYGLKNIQRIAERYDGRVVYEQKEQWFCLSIQLNEKV